MLNRSVSLLVLLVSTCALGADNPWKGLVESATQRYGIPGRKAAQFLHEHHADVDDNIDAAVLDETLAYGMQVRDEFPWTRRLSDYRFHNDVLPYASLDEERCLWRKQFYDICKPIVADCKTASEAAHRINQKFFDAVDVHYNTDRSKTNQSPAEAIAEHRATCTGLSILLVDACRSVGIPARIAGLANWHDKRGNHTWVEIWDDGWHFLGADEPDQRGVDHGWFVRDAARAVPGDIEFGIWATSFKQTGHYFPMIWSRDDKSIAAVEVTPRYLSPFKNLEDGALRFVRVWASEGGKRIWTIVTVLGEDDTKPVSFSTRAGTSDTNDMPGFHMRPDTTRRLIVQYQGEARTTEVSARNDNVETLDLYWDQLKPLNNTDMAFAPLSHDAAEAFIREASRGLAAEIAKARKAELDNKKIQGKNNELRLLEKTFGDAPAEGHSLWISLHGGGNAPSEVNDRQWNNQIELYQLEEGIYVAPRSPSDTWNMWHRNHIDPLFDRLIETYVAARGVNPNRVYLLGYSSGGDGVYQLAPRMADRFAAASMMAGHPNEAKPLGLRNLPFAIFVGEKDEGYGRNAVAAIWAKDLDDLQAKDPEGYPHRFTSYPGLGHWMDGKDAEAIPWMAAHTRNPWPRRIVWYQDDVTHDRFYWLKLSKDDAKKDATIRADVKGQTIAVDSTDVKAVTLRLHDRLIDLDKPIRVESNGQVVFEGVVPRTRDAIQRSFAERLDAPAAAMAELTVEM